MNINDNTLIYIYDPKDEAQATALGALQKLQQYQLVKIEVGGDLSTEDLDTLERALENSREITDSPKEFTRTLKDKPQELSTPIIITWERSMYLEGNQAESFSEQMSWLNN